MSKLDQKPVCIVTGGSSGIGLATAMRFGQLGYRLFICGRDTGTLARAEEQIASVAPACVSEALDLREPAAVINLIETAVENFGRIDVLVNNAGVAPLHPLEQFSKQTFSEALAVNVEAVFHATQAVWPIMTKQGSGVIINISSLSSMDPFPGFSVYGACKAWVNLFTRAIADEGRPLGIRVYSVALGAVETRMLRGLFPKFPPKQTLSPEDVALFLASLCEEPMRHATGQTLILKK